MVRAGFAIFALFGATACLTSKPTSIYGNSYSAGYVSTEGNALGSTVDVVIPHEKIILSNGLQVIVSERHHAPLVSVHLRYAVGSKDDPPGRAGLAHLVEHLMFDGSRHVETGTFGRYLQRMGATEFGGATSLDDTVYWETVPSGGLEAALWLESDRMAFLLEALNQEKLDRHRNVVANEWRERAENVPYGLVSEIIAARVYPKPHPYHHLPAGTIDQLNAVTLDDVRAFVARYCVPNGATLVISGDVSIEKAKSAVTKYFGDVAPGPEPAPVTPRPVQGAGQKVRIEAAVESPLLVVSYPTPAFATQADADLDVIALLLRGYGFREEMFGDRPIAMWATARQYSSRLESRFEIWTMPKKGVNLDTLAAAVFRAISGLPKLLKPWQPRYAAWELEQALFFSTDQNSKRADKLGFYNLMTGDPGYIQDDVARYDSAGGGRIQETLRTYLAENRAVLTYVVPNPSAPVGGRVVEGVR
jgi:zinc protease